MTTVARAMEQMDDFNTKNIKETPVTKTIDKFKNKLMGILSFKKSKKKEDWELNTKVDYINGDNSLQNKQEPVNKKTNLQNGERSLFRAIAINNESTSRLKQKLKSENELLEHFSKISKFTKTWTEKQINDIKENITKIEDELIALEIQKLKIEDKLIAIELSDLKKGKINTNNPKRYKTKNKLPWIKAKFTIDDRDVIENWYKVNTNLIWRKAKYSVDGKIINTEKPKHKAEGSKYEIENKTIKNLNPIERPEEIWVEAQFSWKKITPEVEPEVLESNESKIRKLQLLSGTKMEILDQVNSDLRHNFWDKLDLTLRANILESELVNIELQLAELTDI